MDQLYETFQELEDRIEGLSDCLNSDQDGSLGLALEGLRVTGMLPEGPTERCQQVSVGDKILAINGKPVTAQSVRGELNGKENTLVVLQVKKKGSKEVVDISLVRESSSKLSTGHQLFTVLRKMGQVAEAAKKAGGEPEDEEGREAAVRKLVKSAAGLEKMVEDGQQLVCKLLRANSTTTHVLRVRREQQHLASTAGTLAAMALGQSTGGGSALVDGSGAGSRGTARGSVGNQSGSAAEDQVEKARAAEGAQQDGPLPDTAAGPHPLFGGGGGSGGAAAANSAVQARGRGEEKGVHPAFSAQAASRSIAYRVSRELDNIRSRSHSPEHPRLPQQQTDVMPSFTGISPAPGSTLSTSYADRLIQNARRIQADFRSLQGLATESANHIMGSKPAASQETGGWSVVSSQNQAGQSGAGTSVSSSYSPPSFQGAPRSPSPEMFPNMAGNTTLIDRGGGESLPPQLPLPEVEGGGVLWQYSVPQHQIQQRGGFQQQQQSPAGAKSPAAAAAQRKRQEQALRSQGNQQQQQQHAMQQIPTPSTSMAPSAVSHSVAPRAHMPLAPSPSAPSPSSAQHPPPPNRSNPSPRTARPPPPPSGQSTRPPISHQSPTAAQHFLPSPGMQGAPPIRQLVCPPQRHGRSPGGTWQQQVASPSQWQQQQQQQVVSPSQWQQQQQQQVASPSQWQQQLANHPTSFYPPAMHAASPSRNYSRASSGDTIVKMSSSSPMGRQSFESLNSADSRDRRLSVASDDIQTEFTADYGSFHRPYPPPPQPRANNNNTNLPPRALFPPSNSGAAPYPFPPPPPGVEGYRIISNVPRPPPSAHTSLQPPSPAGHFQQAFSPGGGFLPPQMQHSPRQAQQQSPAGGQFQANAGQMQHSPRQPGQFQAAAAAAAAAAGGQMQHSPRQVPLPNGQFYASSPSRAGQMFAPHPPSGGHAAQLSPRQVPAQGHFQAGAANLFPPGYPSSSPARQVPAGGGMVGSPYYPPAPMSLFPPAYTLSSPASAINSPQITMPVSSITSPQITMGFQPYLSSQPAYPPPQGVGAASPYRLMA